MGLPRQSRQEQPPGHLREEELPHQRGHLLLRGTRQGRPRQQGGPVCRREGIQEGLQDLLLRHQIPLQRQASLQRRLRLQQGLRAEGRQQTRRFLISPALGPEDQANSQGQPGRLRGLLQISLQEAEGRAQEMDNNPDHIGDQADLEEEESRLKEQK